MQRQIEKVWLDNKYINAVTKDGLKARYQISSWPRLAAANRSQLEDFYLSYTGIHWPQIDEDLSFEGMFCAAGLCNRTPQEDSICFIK